MSYDQSQPAAPQPLRETVTRENLDAMKQRISEPSYTLDYTPGGAREAEVHKDIDENLRAKIDHGERTLEKSAETLERDQALSAHEGYARAQHNKAAEVWEPKPDRKPQRTLEPSR